MEAYKLVKQKYFVLVLGVVVAVGFISYRFQVSKKYDSHTESGHKSSGGPAGTGSPSLKTTKTHSQSKTDRLNRLDARVEDGAPSTTAELKKELQILLQEDPSRERRRKLGELAMRFPLPLILSQDSPFLADELTEDEASAIASRVSHILGHASSEELNLAMAGENPLLKGKLTNGIVNGLLKLHPPNEVIELIEKWKPDTPEQGEALKRIAITMGSTNSGEFSALLVSDSGTAMRKYTLDFISSWAADYPQDATAWVVSLPSNFSNEAYQAKLLKRSFATWCVVEPHQASGWLQNLPTGSQRDDLSIELVNNLLLLKDYPVAEQWAKSIGDEKKRKAALKAIPKP